MTTMKRYVSTLFLAILALPFFLPHTFADTPITTAIDNSSAKTYISYYDSSNSTLKYATNAVESTPTLTPTVTPTP